jgi:glucose-1-phosphate adenylyltransferase
MPDKQNNEYVRHVSRLTRDTLALVLAGGQGSRLRELTTWRAKPGLHFGGKYRIIDFPLSNCINSGIRRIGVLTQYKAHSLIRHLVHGWSWFRASKREFVEILPASQRVGGEWYRGTADAIYQNLDIIRTHSPSHVLVLAGDHVYKMDYGPFLAMHDQLEADMTVSCVEVPVEEAAGELGVMTVDESGRVIAFDEKPAHPNSIPGKPGICLASSKQAYWRDVGTLDAYWEANMELVSVTPQLNLYDMDWPVNTHQLQSPPAKFIFDEDERRGMAIQSMVSGGCVVSGAEIRGSMLYSRVRANAGSLIADSVVLPDVEIGEKCRISRAIIDRGSIIPAGTIIGEDHDADRKRGFRVTDSGLTLVTPDMLGQSLHFTR